MKTKLFKSIDGLFKKNLNYKCVNNLQKLNLKKVSLIGKGNSISGIPYSDKSTLLRLSIKKKIEFVKKKNLVEVSGNYEAYNLHNFLLEKNFLIVSILNFFFLNYLLQLVHNFF